MARVSSRTAEYLITRPAVVSTKGRLAAFALLGAGRVSEAIHHLTYLSVWKYFTTEPWIAAPATARPDTSETTGQLAKYTSATLIWRDRGKGFCLAPIKSRETGAYGETTYSAVAKAGIATGMNTAAA